MRAMILIPSRMASTRFPGKPLIDVAGLPMVVRVMKQAEKAGMGPVVVAAGDREIIDAVRAHNGRAVFTDPALPSGSDRIWAGVQALVAQGEEKPDFIINVQGDEPLLEPELIRQSVAILNIKPLVDVVTFAHLIEKEADKNNPTFVKVVTDSDGRALYFSRAAIPHGAAMMRRHVGFYAYRYSALEAFVSAPPSPLEQQEKLEQLRGLEMGLHYHVAHTDTEPYGIDTPEDLQRVLKLLA
jgi:3-deoxy-manno-octulosonate cytidylyltransferase (CMP-KDO synthetase)